MGTGELTDDNGGGQSMEWEEQVERDREKLRQRDPARWDAVREVVRRMPTFELTYRGELTPPEEGDVLAAQSLSPHGDPVALWASPADHEEQIAKDSLPNGVRVPRTQLGRGVPMRFVTYGPETTVTALETRLAVPYAQPLSGGRVLVVGARCVYDPERGPERNAEIHGPDGELLARGTLGDGIAYVRTDTEDGIWAGYFDEGIFGNNGWGRGQGGPDPIGAPGLVRFRDDLTLDCPLPDVAPWGLPGQTPYIALESTAVWASYHNMNETVVVRFDPSEDRETLSGWSLAEEGSRAVPLRPGWDRVVRLGGRFGSHDLMALTALGDDGQVERRAYRRLALPGGVELAHFASHTHAGVLHVFTGTTWWSLDLRKPVAPAQR